MRLQKTWGSCCQDREDKARTGLRKWPPSLSSHAHIFSRVQFNSLQKGQIHTTQCEASILPDPFLSPSRTTTDHPGSCQDQNFLDSSPPSSILGKCFGCSLPFTYFPAPKAQAQIHTKPCFWQCQGVTQESSVFLFFKLSHQFFISPSLPHLTRESQESLVFEY